MLTFEVDDDDDDEEGHTNKYYIVTLYMFIIYVYILISAPTHTNTHTHTHTYTHCILYCKTQMEIMRSNLLFSSLCSLFFEYIYTTHCYLQECFLCRCVCVCVGVRLPAPLGPHRPSTHRSSLMLPQLMVMTSGLSFLTFLYSPVS